MSVTVDAHDGSASGQTYNVSASPIDYVGLTTTASATAILVQFIENETIATGLGTVSSITWDPAGANQAFSLISGTSQTQTGGSNTFKTALYGLASPSSSGNKTIRLSYTAGSHTGYLAAISFAGTDTVTPFHNGTTATSASSAAQSITITSPSGEFAASVWTDDTQGYTSVSGTKNFTNNTGNNGNGAGNYTAGVGSTTLTASPNDIFAASGVSVQPPGSGDVLAASPGMRVMRRKSVGWTPLSDSRARIFRRRPRFYFPRKTIIRAS